MMRAVRVGMLTMALGLVPAVWALAQPQGAAPAAQDGFVPVSQLPAVTEQLPSAPLVIGAYAFIWAATLAYVLLLWRRMAAVDRELSALRRDLQSKS